MNDLVKSDARGAEVANDDLARSRIIVSRSCHNLHIEISRRKIMMGFFPKKKKLPDLTLDL